MRLPVFLLAFVVFVKAGLGSQVRWAVNTDKNDAVESYFEELVPVIDNTVLNQNSGPSSGADPGVIISVIPDPAYPNYSLYYVRDTAVLLHAWLNRLIASNDGAQGLRHLMDDAVRAFIRTQHIENPSGNVFTGGLEETAFNLPLVEVTDPGTRAFTGAPAADGPPSRAGVLIKYAEWLTEPEQNNGTWVADVLWPAIDLDLQWIALHWNQSSYLGSLVSAHLGGILLDGVAAVPRIAVRSPSWPKDWTREQCFFIRSPCINDPPTFWNEAKGFMSETTVTTGRRSGIGAAPLAVSVLNFDPSLGCDSATFQPCSERALSSLKFLIDAYRKHYPINKDIHKDKPVLIGGFLEDSILGAQYFSTFNSAEQLLYALHTWDLLGELKVTKQTFAFFRQFDPDVKIGTFRRGSPTFEIAIEEITAWAHDTILLVSKHTPGDYVLPLSISGKSGEPYGPRGAIRSFAAALTAHGAYNSLIPPSWAHGNYLKRAELDGRIATRRQLG